MKHLKILLVVFTLGFVACETEELDVIEDQDGVSAEATVASSIDLEASVEEADDVLDDISIYSSYFFGIKGNAFGKTDDGHRGHSGFFRECADIVVEETDNSITVTITFNGECEDENGNAITGVVVKTETYTETSSENSLTVTDLSINGYVINGSKTFTWTQSNENGNPQMSGTVDISVDTAEGTISKSGNRTVEITEGANTDTWVDNVKTITGSCTYQGFERTLSMEITTPLVKPAACKFIVSGVKTYTSSAVDGLTTLDYGDGTCDGFATLTLPDGTEEQIILGKKRRDRGHHDHDDDDDDDDDEDDDEDDEDDDDEDDDEDDEDDEDSFMGCILNTQCGEVEFENMAELSVTSEEVDGIFVITVTNVNGEVVYEEECAEGGEVSIECSSESNGG